MKEVHGENLPVVLLVLLEQRHGAREEGEETTEKGDAGVNRGGEFTPGGEEVDGLEDPHHDDHRDDRQDGGGGGGDWGRERKKGSRGG